MELVCCAIPVAVGLSKHARVHTEFPKKRQIGSGRRSALAFPYLYAERILMLFMRQECRFCVNHAPIPMYSAVLFHIGQILCQSCIHSCVFRSLFTWFQFSMSLHLIWFLYAQARAKPALSSCVSSREFAIGFHEEGPDLSLGGEYPKVAWKEGGGKELRLLKISVMLPTSPWLCLCVHWPPALLLEKPNRQHKFLAFCGFVFSWRISGLPSRF